jgi:PilZ domain
MQSVGGMGKLLFSPELQGMVKPKSVRSPRFSVPNNERVAVSIGTEEFDGTVQLLSLTGGAIRLTKRFASGTFGDLRLKTVSGTFSATIEFLRMASRDTQAFRFIAMGTVARKRLEDALNKMREQGLAVEKTPLKQFRELARRILSGRSAK